MSPVEAVSRFAAASRLMVSVLSLKTSIIPGIGLRLPLT
jgi:hypothetical protein